MFFGGIFSNFNLSAHEVCGGELMTLGAAITFFGSGIGIMIGVPITGAFQRLVMIQLSARLATLSKYCLRLFSNILWSSTVNTFRNDKALMLDDYSKEIQRKFAAMKWA